MSAVRLLFVADKFFFLCFDSFFETKTMSHCVIGFELKLPIALIADAENQEKWILSPDGNWITFHSIRQPNSSLNPAFLQPSLPITMLVTKE